MLDRQLRERGGRLIMRQGQPVAELLRLCREVGAEAVFFNRDYEPYARQRDDQMRQALEAEGVRVESFKDRLLIEPDELLTSNGKPFTVYTPYRRRWLALLEEDAALSASRGEAQPLRFATIEDSVPSLPIPAVEELGFSTMQRIAEPGETAAQQQLRTFVDKGVAGLREYHHNRNKLGIEGTSRLAPHLRHGTLSPRAPVRAALQLRTSSEHPDERKACETWLGELAWRDFYTAIMYHFPHVLERPYRDLFVHFPYRDAPDELKTWQEGRTGYPVVDAAMRQLNTEGFMHNRGRLITASFLIKDLLLNYMDGVHYFHQQLTCGDHALNNGNWQWVAGSSNDPQPYFRIFNPVTQGQTYDPDGAYVRRYVPEIANIPDKYIHTPWTMPQQVAEAAGVKLGRDYPLPIVDHKEARARAQAAFKQLRDEFYAGKEDVVVDEE
jgi:deoxyribodipyrimidine photo-lyase